jgi:hypothetical protein
MICDRRFSGWATQRKLRKTEFDYAAGHVATAIKYLTPQCLLNEKHKKPSPPSYCGNVDTPPTDLDRNRGNGRASVSLSDALAHLLPSTYVCEDSLCFALEEHDVLEVPTIGPSRSIDVVHILRQDADLRSKEYFMNLRGARCEKGLVLPHIDSQRCENVPSTSPDPSAVKILRELREL